MAKIYKYLLFFFIICFGIQQSKAQELSTQGKTFWMTFMETVGGFGCTDNSAPELKLVISCDKATSGTIKNISTLHSISFSIGAGGGVDTVLVPAYMGYTTGSEASSLRNRALLIQAADTISVSAQNTKQYSCDASLIYPIEALGVDYRVLSHMGDQSGNNSCYKSSFAIVATEDNTSITITPSCATTGGKAANTPFSITLNKGETYQVLASTNKLDLSGTLVQAFNCKKIAVFGGSIRSSVLNGANNSCASSYDHLFEEMMPINLWGKKFIVIPTLYDKGKQRKTDMIKVVSNAANTFVRCNGRFKILALGATDTFFVRTNSVITSTKPIGVCQYGLSEDCDKVGGGGTNTDPMMIWVPPVEQSLKNLSFSCEVALQVNKFFLNVIVKTSKKNTFQIDGSSPTATWTQVGYDTSYSFLQQDGLSSGKHNISNPFGFSAVLYAYGDHSSYGYNAGSSVKALNFYMTVGGKSSADLELDTPYFVACEGTKINFDIATSYTPTSYKWLFSDGYKTQTTKFFTRQFFDTGFIKVTGICFRPTVGVCNGVASDTLVQYVKVYPKPKINLLNDTTICKGNSFYITSKTDGDTNYIFSPGTWLSCTNCMVPLASPLMDTTYTVVATTKGCPPSRDTFTVKIRDSLFLFKSNDTTICRGTTTTLSASAKGGLLSGQTITWDNGLGTGLTKVVSPKVTTTYRMILTDGCTRDNSSNFYADTNFIKVTVYDSLKLTMPKDTIVCEGNSVTFSPTVVGGRPGTTLLTWNQSLGTGFTQTVTMGTLTTTYKAVLSDGCTNPKDSGYVTVQVRPGLKIDTIMYPTPVCRNAIFKVNLILSGGDSTGYRVKLLNTTIPGPPVVVDSFNNSAYPSFNIQIPDDSKFKISFSQTCNSNNAPLKGFNVKIKNSLNVISTVLVDTVCTGQSYNILATGSSPDNLPIKFILKKKTGVKTYLPVDSMSALTNASFNITPTTTLVDYIIIGDDKCNRTDTSYFRMMLRAPLVLTSSLNDTALCRDKNVNFSTNSIGGKRQSITYNWTDASTNSLLGNTQSILVILPVTSMDINLKVDDGCSAPVTDNVRLYIAPVITDSTLATDLAGCEPYSTTFFFPTTLAQPINPSFDWVWYFKSASSLTSTSTASSGGQTHSPIGKNYNSAGSYEGRVELKLKNGSVCNSYKQQIDVWNQAVADFDYSPVVIDIIEPLVSFTNKSAGATMYSWNFGDTLPFTSSDENPQHSYKDTGAYLVTLIATNSEGCADTTAALEKYKLRVLDIFRIWIPTAFSPNTDDINSYWFPNATSIQSMEYEIFNRWGEQIFVGNENMKWFGQYGNSLGMVCPEGIYYYHVKVRDNRKKWHYYNGTLTLLR